MESNDKYLHNASTTASLIEAGIELMRQNIKRNHPALVDDQVDDLLASWLYKKTDPVPGDTAGAVRVRERLT